MTNKYGLDLTKVLRDQEAQLLENFLIPNKLVIDFAFIYKVFGRLDIVKYKLPLTGTLVPVVEGDPGQILVLGSKEVPNDHNQ